MSAVRTSLHTGPKPDLPAEAPGGRRGPALFRLARLGTADRALLLQTLFLVAVARVGLWTGSWKRVMRVLRNLTPTRAGDPADQDRTAERIVWAVTAASRRIPAATCLTQALVAQALLDSNGIKTTLQIGVARDRDSAFRAHAWVKRGERVLIGGNQTGEYRTLLSMEGLSS